MILQLSDFEEIPFYKYFVDSKPTKCTLTNCHEKNTERMVERKFNNKLIEGDRLKEVVDIEPEYLLLAPA